MAILAPPRLQLRLQLTKFIKDYNNFLLNLEWRDGNFNLRKALCRYVDDLGSRSKPFLLSKEMRRLKIVGKILRILPVLQDRGVSSCNDLIIPQPGNGLANIVDVLAGVGDDQIAGIDLG